MQQNGLASLIYIREVATSGAVSEGDLYLAAPNERLEPRRFAQAAYDIVTFVPEPLVPISERSHVLFYWLCNPLFLAFIQPQPEPLRVPPNDRPQWETSLTRLEAETKGTDLGSEEASRALLSLLLVDAARLSAERYGTAPLAVQPLLARVFDVIEVKFREPLSLADVASTLHLTPAYLTTAVREATGRTVNDWIAERRMAEARRLLLREDTYVASIGERVGYPDPAYFNRKFRGRHGMTPLQYRKQHRAI